MAKRYVYKVLYGNEVIEKIDVEVTEKDCLTEEAEDFASIEANARALDKLQVELEEVIEEE